MSDLLPHVADFAGSGLYGQLEAVDTVLKELDVLEDFLIGHRPECRRKTLIFG
jgi:50S ribosomal subunit-associated GTPase HflX